MKIRYTYSWPLSGLETIIELGNGYIRKGVYNPYDFSSLPQPTSFCLPDDGRLECLLKIIALLEDGEIGRVNPLISHPQVLSISNIGYFKWYTRVPPQEWKVLAIFLKYLYMLAKEIKQPSLFKDNLTLEEYCEVLKFSPDTPISHYKPIEIKKMKLQISH